MTYTHPLPNGGTLTTSLNTTSEASIKAGLAEVARVAALVAPVSQVDAVVGEQAVAILERLQSLLRVESLGAVEAEVERMVGPDVLTEWPSGPTAGRWAYHLLSDKGEPKTPRTGCWFIDADDGRMKFIDEYGFPWFDSDFSEGERFVRIWRTM